ncbi:MAG: hypothetical protein KatS3mg102_0825 [Planctomycetota bacterium]|nr:MAG: hypothetical protein KatS3mg102_0825 [Planctomycetota bacterium]
MIGTWAHALSWQAPHLERRLPPVRMDDLVHREGRAMTHLLIDEGWMGQLGPRFAQAGVRLVPLARLAIRGHPVVLFRFPWAEALGYRPSPLERAVERGQPQATRPPPEPRTR